MRPRKPKVPPTPTAIHSQDTVVCLSEAALKLPDELDHMSLVLQVRGWVRSPSVSRLLVSRYCNTLHPPTSESSRGTPGNMWEDICRARPDTNMNTLGDFLPLWSVEQAVVLRLRKQAHTCRASPFLSSAPHIPISLKTWLPREYASYPGSGVCRQRYHHVAYTAWSRPGTHVHCCGVVTARYRAVEIRVVILGARNKL